MHRITILGEILRGENFENEQIIVVYELLMEEQKSWYLDSEDSGENSEDFNVTKSVTQMALCSQGVTQSGQQGKATSK